MSKSKVRRRAEAKALLAASKPLQAQRIDTSALTRSIGDAYGIPKTWGVVVPSCRAEQLTEFLSAWEELFDDHDVALYIVWDGEGDPPELVYPAGVLRSADAPWWVPRQTDMCRSWGFWHAYQDGCEFIVSLDDDVRPVEDDLFVAYEVGFAKGYPCSPYFDVGVLTGTRLQMRGFPYASRDAEVMVQFGGWDGVPDLDGQTQLVHPGATSVFASQIIPVPRGAAVTGCAMNMAFRREATPWMWQFPLHEGRFNRFGDIWGGLVAKRMCDLNSKVILVNGLATVRHDRASDPVRNAEIEAAGLPYNEGIWRVLGSVFLKSWVAARNLDELGSAHERVAHHFDFAEPEYAAHLRKAAAEWRALFQ